MICDADSLFIPTLSITYLLWRMSEVSLCILYTSPLIETTFTDIFTHAVGWFFTLLMIYVTQKNIHFYESQVIYFSFII